MNESRKEEVPTTEWAAFYNDAEFWNGLYVEEDDDGSYLEKHFHVGGAAIVPRNPGGFVELAMLDGALGWQGEGTEPADMPTTTIELYRRWKAQGRKVLSIVVEIPPEQADAFAKAVATVQGARILNPPAANHS
jgi:hypothetical protein